MTGAETCFPISAFPVVTDCIPRHANAVAAVLVGRKGAISVVTPTEAVTGDILFVRPGIEHRVDCAGGGINVIYLDGLAWNASVGLAVELNGQMANLAIDAFGQNSDAALELRAQLAFGDERSPPALQTVIGDLLADPMSRMPQSQLADRLRIERTQALRIFKSATGMTFRNYKRWVGLQHAARQMVAGETVRNAAMDSGFADTAHLSRTFKHWFGLTPSQAIAALPVAAAR